jgi:hypothetical protein
MAGTALAGLLAVGCGTTTTPASTPTPATATPASTATLETGTPTPSPLPAPSGWTYLGWSDPSLEVALPAGWQTIEYPLPSGDAQGDPHMRELVDWTNRKVAQGAVRLGAYGTAMTRLPSVHPDGSIIVTVESGDESLGAFADRASGEVSFLHPFNRTDVELPAGPAVELDYRYTSSGQDTIERDVLFRLADGRSLMLAISAWSPSGENPHEVLVLDFADVVARTMRPSQ